MERKTGRVIFFNPKSKFGFIKEIDTGTDYYFSGKNSEEILLANDEVTFNIKEMKRGPEAFDIKKINKEK